MALTQAPAELLNLDSGLTITGTTPYLVIGDAGAEDTKIVFDGNAQDYYIGLDDSADSLLIGRGATVGTTAAITVDSSSNSSFSGLITAAAKARITDTGNTTVAALQFTDAGLGISAPTTDQMNFITADTTRMVINSSGNVGIGTGSVTVASALHVYAATGDVGITIEAAEDNGAREPFLNLKSYATNANPVINFGDHAGYPGNIQYENGDDSMRFATNGAERMFITSGGTLNVGPEYSSTAANGDFLYMPPGSFNAGVDRTSSANVCGFRNNNGEIGIININGSTCSFTNLSDYRKKQNVDYSWDATSRLKQLKPARFSWIADSTNTLQDGFLAHEVSSICPEAVVGEKDGVYTAEEAKESEYITEGEAKNQMLDSSKLIPLMVKTIQEQQALIETLQTKVKALEEA